MADIVVLAVNAPKTAARLRAIPESAANDGRRVVAIDTSKAEKGSPVYNALNSPEPNTIYKLDNGTVFKTDESGVVTEVTFQPA